MLMTVMCWKEEVISFLSSNSTSILLSFSSFSFSFKMSSNSSTPLPSLGVLPEASNKVNGGKQKQKEEPSSSSTSKQSSLRIEIDGKPALIRHDDEFLYVYRGNHQEDEIINISRSYLLVPLALVLHASFVPDSDGGSLLVRVLSPPLTSKSPLALYLKKQQEKEASSSSSSTTNGHSSSASSSSRSKLKNYLEGPCSNLRLVKIEARLSDKNSNGTEGQDWASRVMSLAYDSFSVSPFRRLKILINPIGGQGKSVSLFEQKVRPILEASGCKLSIEVTKYRYHGHEIAKNLDLEKFDCLICVSGDGMLHEVLNGFASRSDAREAFKRITVVPIPAGSGNATSVNLVGAKNAFSLSLACLNIIKGRRMNLDICSVTQPNNGSEPITNSSDNTSSTLPLNGSSSLDDSTPSTIPTPPKLPFVRYYSFLSQAIGLMADLDLGTEDLRALGDARFIIGFLGGVIKHSTCEVDIDVKLGQKGSLNRREMRKRRLNWDWSSLGEDQDESKEEEEEVQEQVSGEEIKTSLGEEVNHGEEESKAWRTDALGNKIPTKIKNLNMPDLTHGAVTDDLGELESFEPKDPSWPTTATTSNRDQESSSTSSSEWKRINVPISSLYAGKLPYVARDLLQFPYSIPGDETIDLALQLLKGGRIGKLKAIGGAESGQVVFDQGLSYLKVEAFRVTPRLKEGDKKLKKGGLISIDGEKVDWNKFQVEVVKDVKFGVMSLYGVLCTPDVKPEGLSGDDQWEENH